MLKHFMEKFGPVGAVLAAAACPVCFPKLALIGAIVGFGALAKYETAFFIAAQMFMLLSLFGHLLVFRAHRHRGILGLAVGSVCLFFLSLYLIGSEWLTYAGFFGLFCATAWIWFESRRCKRCEAERENA